MFTRQRVWQFQCDCGFWTNSANALEYDNGCPCCGASKPLVLGKIKQSGQGKRFKEWLLSPQAGFDGNGSMVPCFWCQALLTPRLVTVDRWPLGADTNGRHTQDNVVPACAHCNHTRESRPEDRQTIQVPKVFPKTFMLYSKVWKAYLRVMKVGFSNATLEKSQSQGF